MNDKKYDAIVIGAGHNGLVTAGYLARDGLKVLVLERLDKIGGAVTTDEFAPGFWGPMCSFVVHGLRGKIIDELKLKDHGFEIARRSGAGGRIHPFPDGTFLGGPEVRDDLDLAQQIRQFSENDARSYFSWVDFWEQAGSIFRPYFLTEPPAMADIFEDVRGTRQEEVLEKLLTWSYVDMVEDYFEDGRTRAHAMGWAECDPRQPGSLMLTAIHRAESTREEDRGIPRMSMGNVSGAMAAAAESFGAEIRTQSPVQKVLVEEGNAVGVQLAGGEEIHADIVISNADPKRTFSTLFEPDQLADQTLRNVKRWKTKAGCVKFLAGMKELPDFSSYLGQDYDPMSITSVRIMPSVDYYVQSWIDCDAGRPSSCPIMGIQFTSVAEPGLTPRGGHVMSNWVLFYNPELKDTTWDAERDKVGESLIAGVTEYAPNFRDSLVDWTVQTPLDIETRVGMTDGNIHHLDEIPSQMLNKRQSYRTEINNFYMCGAGTHPAGEVTGAPGHNAAHAILRDLERIPH